MSLAPSWRGFWPRPDPRSPREIDDQIAAEIEFHLEEASDELEATGLTRDEARRRALERFGNVEQVRAECRRVQTGGVQMLIKVQFAVIALLGCAVFALGFDAWSTRREFAEQHHRSMAELDHAREAERTAFEERLAAERALAVAQASAGAGHNEIRTAVAAAERSPADEARAIAERVHDWFQADANNWRVGLAAAQRIADQLEPEVAFEVIRELYPYLSVTHREQLFKPFVFDGGHPMALGVLELGARDGTGSVRERAFGYLRNYAFRDFSADFEAYDDWARHVAKLSLPEVFAHSAKSLVTRLSAAQNEELALEMRVLSELDLRAARKHGGKPATHLREAGLLDLIEQWLASDHTSHVVFGLRAASWLELSRAEHERFIDPLIERDWSALDSDSISDEYCRLVGVRGQNWAVERMMLVVETHVVAQHRAEAARPACHALAEIADTSVIPRLIDVLRREDSESARYSIGYYALRPLTGVVYDASHGAAWWSDWWHKNSSRF